VSRALMQQPPELGRERVALFTDARASHDRVTDTDDPQRFARSIADPTGTPLRGRQTRCALQDPQALHYRKRHQEEIPFHCQRG
jgi:hypothetical protein